MFNRLSTFIERRMILAEAQGSVLLARRRVDLMKQAYDDSKVLLQRGKTKKVSMKENYIILTATCRT